MDSNLDSRKEDPRTRDLRLRLSKNLQQSNYGNVEFYHLSNPTGPRLYAFSHFWEYPSFESCGTVWLYNHAYDKFSTLVFRGKVNLNLRLTVAVLRLYQRQPMYRYHCQDDDRFPSTTTFRYLNRY